MLLLRQPFFLISFFLLLSYGAFCQEEKPSFEITRYSVHYPHNFKEWKLRTALGFSMVNPPQDLLENAIQAPLVNLHLVYGLPWNFSLEGTVTTIIVSNQLTLGPRYNLLIKKFSANAGFDLAYSFGFLNIGGFDNNAQIWSWIPNLSAGYRIGNVAMTLKGELSIINTSSSRSGENEVSRSTNRFNGGTLGLYIEQRMWKNKVFVAGFKDNYVKFYWPVWMLFTTFDRYYHVPELYFSWVL